MSIEIQGVAYFSATDIYRDLGIVRQTLWRWRRARTIPQGRRYRGRQIVFTKEEVEEIRQFANRLEPAELSDTDQLKLFNSTSVKRSG
jgi:predicted DNA-binding transcriptional regulator AlpA